MLLSNYPSLYGYVSNNTELQLQFSSYKSQLLSNETKESKITNMAYQGLKKAVLLKGWGTGKVEYNQ